MGVGFLDGVRVLDLSQYLPGPFAGQILADLGAEVVKVEPPHGDPMRRLGPLERDGLSAFYKLINAGKTVIHLDLKDEVGRATFRRLLGRAHVLLESYRPGALAGIGFGHDELRSANPHLVHCALSGYGQTGPDAGRAGHDLNYMAVGGGLATSGTHRRPVFAYPPTADCAGALQAALTITAALLQGMRTGEGCFLDVSLTETVLAWQAMNLTAACREGHVHGRAASTLNGGAACYQIYEAADGRFVTLGALEEKFWANFCRAVRREDWVSRQWEPMPQQALIGEVAALFSSRPSAHWERALAGIDCCFQPILEPHEVPDHPQFRARSLLVQRDGLDPRIEVLFPVFVDGRPPTPRRPVRIVDGGQILTAWQAL